MAGALSMTMGDTRDGKPELYGVGGWLAFLCVSLLILTPLGLLLELVQTVLVFNRSAPTPETVFGIAFGIILAAFAVFAGLGLLRIWRNAVRTAKWYFFINAGFGALAFAGFMVEPEGTGPSEFIAVVRWFIGSIAWLAYLYRSERVRNTYGQNTARDAAEVFR
jgi:hypothetical protein